MALGGQLAPPMAGPNNIFKHVNMPQAKPTSTLPFAKNSFSQEQCGMIEYSLGTLNVVMRLNFSLITHCTFTGRYSTMESREGTVPWY